MDPNDTLKLIERFFENDLSNDEQDAFQQRLENDPTFAKAFQLEKELMEGIEAFGNGQLRQQLEMIHQEETGGAKGTTSEDMEPPIYTSPFDPQPVDGKVVSMVGRRWWLAAAVLILGLVARWVFSEKQPTPQQLYAIYAIHEFDFTEMGTNDDLLPKAEVLLKAGDFSAAMPLLDSYLQAKPDDLQIQMAKGIALTETGKYEGALEVFRSIETTSPIFANEAVWNRAMAFLKKGDVENCRNALNTIQANSTHYKDAKILLGYLK